ncbi:MAG TPA: hypothetical protein VF598_05770 [Hymenobacter sp.]|jgi:hypothetical protein
MKSLLLLLSVALLAASCSKTEVEVIPSVPPAPKDPDEVENVKWARLKLPSDSPTDQVYAVAGDLDKTLLVATQTKVYASSDGGKKWKESKNFQAPVPYLLQRNDTVFAFRFTKGGVMYGERTAFEVSDITIDYGKTWIETQKLPQRKKYLKMEQPTGRVQVAGSTYYIKANIAPPPNSTPIASDLIRITGTEQTILTLPSRHYLNNLHLDAQNRLYVAASGLTFDEKTGEPIQPKDNKQVILYVSRKPLP